MKKNRTVVPQYNYHEPQMKTIENWICGIIALVSGSFAYINPPSFLRIDMLNITDTIINWLYAMFVAASSTAVGLLVKHWYDKKGKRLVEKLFRKKKIKP